ncbi:MAG: luciferase-like protein, partial [uncultured Thermomicrobiales bacterium]
GGQVRGVRAAGLEDGPGRDPRPGRAVRGDDRRRQGGRCRAELALGLAVRPLPHRARADDGDHLRVLDVDRDARARHRAGADRADGRLQRLPQPRPLRQDRLDRRRRQPRAPRRRDRRRLVRARVAGLRLRLPGDPGADGDVPRGRPGDPPDVDGGQAQLRGQALHHRRADQRAEERLRDPRQEDPALDRGGRREGHAQARRPVRRRLQHRARPRDRAAQARGASGPLRGSRPGLRRDHQVGGGRRCPDRRGGGSRTGDGPVAGRGGIRRVRRQNGHRSALAGPGPPSGDGRRGHRLLHHLHAGRRLRPGAAPPLRPRGDPGVRL